MHIESNEVICFWQHCR